MKKIISLMLVVAVIISSLCTFSVAASGIKIQINGQNKVFDVMPQIVDGRTLVPMRGIFEEFGADIHWDEKTRTVKATVGDITVTLIVNYPRGDVNGKDVNLDVPPKIIDGRTMVPVRFIAEALGCKVDWDGNSQTVIITGKITGNTDGTSDSSKDLTIGEMESLEYKNHSLGIGFKLPNGWIFLSREEINDLYGYVGKIMNIDDYMTVLEANGSYLDMSASSPLGDNIQVTVNKSFGISEKEYCQQVALSLSQQVASYGINVKNIECVNINITGAVLDGVKIESEYNGVNVYQLILVKNVGEYSILYTISALDKAKLNDIAINLFVL